MTVSICAYDMSARDLLDLGVAADEAGFDALWLGEHIVLPVGYETAHPTTSYEDSHHITGPIIDPKTRLLEPWVALSALAAVTSGLRLATGIYLLPLRHPLLTARSACTLQEISDGRLVLGLGAGWLEEEFQALGVPFQGRYRRFEESIELLRTAWSGGPFEHEGEHFRTPRVQVTREPVEVPLILGGNTPAALRRAAELGDGWFSSGTPTLDAAVAIHTDLQALVAANGRTRDFRCYFRVEGFDPEVIERYRECGIDDVVVWADQLWPPGSVVEKRASLQAAAEALGLSPRPIER